MAAPSTGPEGPPRQEGLARGQRRAALVEQEFTRGGESFGAENGGGSRNVPAWQGGGGGGAGPARGGGGGGGGGGGAGGAGGGPGGGGGGRGRRWGCVVGIRGQGGAGGWNPKQAQEECTSGGGGDVGSPARVVLVA